MLTAATLEGPLLEDREVRAWTGQTEELCDAPTINMAIPAAFQPVAKELEALERQRMKEALRFSGGSRTRAAALIDMPLRTFATKLKQYGLFEGEKAG